MIYLGIETSCDETACALVEDGRNLLSAKLVSQIDVHQQFGGVVPEVAARRHLEAINPLIDAVFDEAGLTMAEIDAVACTVGPGLIGTLLVGLSAAKCLAWSYDKPLISVDHILAHVCANYVGTDLEPPFVALVVSGGHTQIMHFKDYQDYEILGQTLDDASGEAYDKVARLLGLGYPGGPAVDRQAAMGNPSAFALPEASIPGYDFSFSGLKTAVSRLVDNLSGDMSIPDICASFQNAVNRALHRKTMAAVSSLGLQKIVLAGGVAANRDLRDRFEREVGVKLYRPTLDLCTDNAIMVASAAHFTGQAVPLSVGAYSRQH